MPFFGGFQVEAAIGRPRSFPDYRRWCISIVHLVGRQSLLSCLLRVSRQENRQYRNCDQFPGIHRVTPVKTEQAVFRRRGGTLELPVQWYMCASSASAATVAAEIS